MKKDTLKSVVVLTAICLVIAIAMSATNLLTAPIIKEAQEKAEKEALFIVLPTGHDFEKLELDGLSENVSAIYRDVDGSGYAIMLSVAGYDASKPMSIAVGISNEGRISSCYVVSCSGETSGIGTKIAGEDFLYSFVGVDETLLGVDAISGATISSSAFIEAVRDAFDAFKIAKGGE